MKIKIYKLNCIEKIICILLIFTLMAEFLSTEVNEIFSYSDEVFVIIILVIGMIKILSKHTKMRIQEIFILGILGVIYIIGIIGNKVSCMQTNKFAIYTDMLNWIKFWGTYIFLQNIISKEKVSKYYEIFIIIIKITLIISLILEILNILNLNVLTNKYDRFGLHSFCFIDGHPSTASSIFAVFSCFLLYDYKNNKKWIVCSILLEILTFRFKALAFVVALIIEVIIMRKRVSVSKIMLICGILIVVAWQPIKYYFLDSTASRAVALNTSIKIANEYNPIGLGFATFGTSPSGKFYSNAYKKYGLWQRWGFTDDNYSYIGDGGWASVIGQFGFLGTVLFIIMIVLLYFSAKGRCFNKSKIYWLGILTYILIASTNEVFFCSAYSIFFSMALSILIKKEEIKGEIE